MKKLTLRQIADKAVAILNFYAIDITKIYQSRYSESLYITFLVGGKERTIRVSGHGAESGPKYHFGIRSDFWFGFSAEEKILAIKCQYSQIINFKKYIKGLIS